MGCMHPGPRLSGPASGFAASSHGLRTLMSCGAAAQNVALRCKLATATTSASSKGYVGSVMLA